jgi:predicted phage terminase large subunit-like protein
LANRDLAKFIEYIDAGFTPAAHHKLLIGALEAVERREIDRLMVLMPPGSAKSTYTSVLFPPWFMGRNPQASVLGVSNTTDLAERFSRRARNIASLPRYRNVFGYGVAENTKSAGNWETEQGGEFFAAGVGSAIAGRRADLGLIDDPIKTREEADSDRVRQKQWDWYVNDFTTRLKPGARQILIQTRWHEDDLGGRILEREANRWVVMKLPMIAGIDDPLKRQPGERLWPEWFTDEMVTSAKMDVRAWNALYQQDPAPETGDYFERDFFNEYTEAPANLHKYGASDYAVTEGGGDYTEHGMFGLDFNNDIYVLDWWRGQTNSDVWIETQCDMIIAHKPLTWFGESGPIRKAIEPFLKRRMLERRAECHLEWLPSIGDKVIRARAFQARASMGKVFLPKHASWLPELVSQLMRFPAGKYDDGVDCCSLIGRGLEYAQAPEIKREAPVVNRQIHSGANGWMG